MIRIFVAALLAWMACAPAEAQTFQAAPGLGGLSVDLDTQSGNFSEWKTTEICVLNELRASVLVARLGDDRRWAPGVNFFLQRGGERVGLRFMSRDRRRPFTAMFVHYNAGQTVEETPLRATFALDAPVDVVIHWDADGAVTVSVGNESRVLRLAGFPQQLSISNSTSEAKIDPLQLGVVGPSLTCMEAPAIH